MPFFSKISSCLLLVLSCSILPSFGQNPLNTIKSERAYFNHLGNIDGKELYVYSKIVKDELVLEFVQNNSIVTSAKIGNKGSKALFPKCINERIFTIKETAINGRFVAQLIEYDKDLNLIRSTILLEYAHSEKKISSEGWFDANDQGLVYLHINEHSGIAKKVSYSFKTEDIQDVSLELNGEKEISVTQGIIDDDLNLTVLNERDREWYRRENKPVRLLVFKGTKASLFSFDQYSSDFIYEKGFYLFRQASKINLIGVRSFFKSYSDREFLGYCLYSVSEDGQNLIKEDPIVLTNEHFNSSKLWNTCEMERFQKTGKFIALTQQRVLDVRPVGNDILLTSMVEGYSGVENYSTGQDELSSVNQTKSDFIITRINLANKEVKWQTKSKDRYSVSHESLPQLYDEFPYFHERTFVERKRCFMVSTTDQLAIFYNDHKDYKKSCFNGDKKAAEESDPTPGFSANTSQNIGKYLIVNLEDGLIREGQLHDLVGEQDVALRYVLTYAACRTQDDGVTLLMQSQPFFSYGSAQEIYLTFNELFK